jgi:hypothetical protein
MAWYGIRSIYLFAAKPNGVNVFEERIVCIEAAGFDEAHAKGAKEAKAYAKENGLERHPDQVAYEQEGEYLVDEYEVWSELYESADTLQSFWDRRYAQYEYRPD